MTLAPSASVRRGLRSPVKGTGSPKGTVPVRNSPKTVEGSATIATNDSSADMESEAVVKDVAMSAPVGETSKGSKKIEEALASLSLAPLKTGAVKINSEHNKGKSETGTRIPSCAWKNPGAVALGKSNELEVSWPPRGDDSVGGDSWSNDAVAGTSRSNDSVSWAPVSPLSELSCDSELEDSGAKTAVSEMAAQIARSERPIDQSLSASPLLPQG